jgi:drug/metabolite transporter (DMT)-like permease
MSPIRANGLLLLAALLWGGGNVAQKTILNELGPFTAVGLRCIIAAVFIAPFIFPRAKLLSRASFPVPLALVTVASFTAGVVTMQTAYGLNPVTTTGFLINTAAVMTPVASWLITGERPSPIIWIAALLTVLGVGLIGGDATVAFGWGETLSLFSAVCFAIWSVCLGMLVKIHAQPGFLSLGQFLLAGIVSLAAGLGTESLTGIGLVQAIPELAVLGIFSTAIAFLLQAVAQQWTSASIAAIIVSFEAVFGAIGGHIVLGERLQAQALIGIVLMMSSIILINIPGGRWRTSLRRTAKPGSG